MNNYFIIRFEDLSEEKKEYIKRTLKAHMDQRIEKACEEAYVELEIRVQ